MCKTDILIDFLEQTESDNLYLVGDIIDGWKLKKKWYWPSDHNTVIQKILRKSKNGTNVVYLPGNHDEFSRNFLNISFGGIPIKNEYIHVGIDNKKYLIIHGDQYDAVIQHAKWLAYFGDKAYSFAIFLNNIVNYVRTKTGYGPYWSLSSFLKHKVKNAVSFIINFEISLAEMAKMKKVDGIICGHIHTPSMRVIDNIIYFNDGDFCESCSAIVEDYHGIFYLVEFINGSWVKTKKFDPSNNVVVEINQPLTKRLTQLK